MEKVLTHDSVPMVFCGHCGCQTPHHHAPRKQSFLAHAVFLTPPALMLAASLYDPLFRGMAFFAAVWLAIYAAMAMNGVQRRKGHFQCERCHTIQQL